MPSLEDTKMKPLLIAMTLITPLGLVGVVRADHTLQEFQDARGAGGAKWQALQLYVEGVGDGFELALRRPLPGTSTTTTTNINGILTTTTVATANGASRPQPPYCQTRNSRYF
jgi:hypothetical protein